MSPIQPTLFVHASRHGRLAAVASTAQVIVILLHIVGKVFIILRSTLASSGVSPVVSRRCVGTYVAEIERLLAYVCGEIGVLDDGPILGAYTGGTEGEMSGVQYLQHLRFQHQPLLAQWEDALPLQPVHPL